MNTIRMVAAVTMVGALAACGADAGERLGTAAANGDALPAAEPMPAVDGSSGEPAFPVVADVPDARRAVPSAPAPVAPGAVDVPSAPARPELQELEQPAIWPAADVVFDTPEEAAADFVRGVLISDGEPALGEFRQGDSRSGEIDVLFTGEDGTLDPPMVNGLLSLRRLGPSNGWFVIGASSDGATITSPDALAQVLAGDVEVTGEARGFEATVVVRAFPPGEPGNRFDQAITSGGAFADVEPYTATIDLSGAAAGDVVAVVVQGDTGLGSDPSTFAAIPVVIGPVIPETR